jgi:transposase
MEKKSRRKFSADFKAKVVLESVKERSSVEELARKYEIHPTQINTWKREFLEKASTVFAGSESVKEDQQSREQTLEKLYAQIGQLKVENDFLKKKLQ